MKNNEEREGVKLWFKSLLVLVVLGGCTWLRMVLIKFLGDPGWFKMVLGSSKS